MIKTIRYLGILITLGLLIFLGMSSTFPTPAATPTPTQSATAEEIALKMQAGQSDGILMLGVLIFIFIAVPIVIRYRSLRDTK
jgi:hypothetical protein